MRLLVAGLRSVPDTEGGVESHARCLYPLVRDLGWDVEIIVRRPFHAASKSNDWNGIRLVPLWSPIKPGAEALIHSLLATLYAIWSRPDVFHVHAIGPAIWVPLARLFGIKVVVTHHGPDYDREKWGAIGKLVLKTGERFGMRFANRRIVISQTIRKLIQKKYQLNSTVIPNGVNRPDFTGSNRLLEQLGLKNGRYILQVSRFVPEKRQNDLVRAFLAARLDGWQLVFAGRFDPDDPYCRDVEALADDNENIVFAGFRKGEELTELFQNAGLFVLPSSHEGLPIALLEAMSFGLRVLASDIPANLEVRLPESSFFQLGNIDELADRLRTFCGQTESSDAAAARTRWVLERYSWQEIAHSTVAVYQDALGLSAVNGT